MKAVRWPAPRPRVARLSDVPAMAELIEGYASRGLMLPKSTADLSRHIREYRVVTDGDGRLLGCGGLRLFHQGLAEIVGLAVASDAHGRGIGASLVRSLVADAEELGVARVFAMALEVGFFDKLGFEPVPTAWLPEKVAADCRSCARRAGCREIAVQRVLRVEATAPAPGPIRRGRPLRVLSV